jgi:hypothetical protein
MAILRIEVSFSEISELKLSSASSLVLTVLYHLCKLFCSELLALFGRKIILHGHTHKRLLIHLSVEQYTL